MPVYVDDMKASFGHMIMCHMVADTTAELLVMADAIGIRRKWIQYPNTDREHFDIALSKRSLAISHGAIPITWRVCGMMQMRLRAEGKMGSPEEAEDWWNSRNKED